MTSLHWQQQSPFINIVDLALFTASARRSRTGRSTRRPSPAAEWQRTCSPRIVETALLRPGRTSTLLLSAQRGNWVLLSSLLQHLGSFVPKKTGPAVPRQDQSLRRPQRLRHLRRSQGNQKRVQRPRHQLVRH